MVVKQLSNYLTLNNLYAFNVHKRNDVCFPLVHITDETTFITLKAVLRKLKEIEGDC